MEITKEQITSEMAFDIMEEHGISYGSFTNIEEYKKCIDMVINLVAPKPFMNKLNFAEHLMIQLLSTKPEGAEYSEISPENLTKIKKVLSQWK